MTQELGEKSFDSSHFELNFFSLLFKLSFYPLHPPKKFKKYILIRETFFFFLILISFPFIESVDAFHTLWILTVYKCKNVSKSKYDVFSSFSLNI